jgi:hypothetical protein
VAVETSSRNIVPPSACLNLPALHVAEKFTLQQGLGQRPAGNLDERPSAAVGAVMDCPGDHALARAAFAGHKDGRGRVGDGLHQVEDLDHLVVVADDVAEAVAFGELVLQRPHLGRERLLRQDPLDAHLDFVVDDGLRQIIGRPLLDRPDGVLDRAVAGDHDDGGVGIAVADHLEEFEAVGLGHRDVRDDEVERGGRQARGGLAERLGRLDEVAFEAQELRQARQDDLVVIHDEDACASHKAALQRNVSRLMSND